MSSNEIDYCGGEMDGWSDPVAADDVLVAHATRMATGLPDAEPNVLLVGARAAALTAPLLADGRDVTVIVRGVADAERLAGTGAHVVCGSFDAWHPTKRFDLAVVLDPPSGVLAASSEGMSFLELAARVREGAAADIVYVENGAALGALDRCRHRPDDDRDFGTLAPGDDLRPPTLDELPERPVAAVFAGAVVTSGATTDTGVRTLLRSLHVHDLRRDALLSDPLCTADGWLLGRGVGGDALTYRRIDGALGHDVPRVEGTPVETRLRRLLLRGDRVRVGQGLSAYLRWSDGAPAPLLRNLVATEHAFAAIDDTIDDTVAAVDAPTAMLDLAAGLGPFDHPFGPELNRQEVATELLRTASDSRDPGAEIAHAVEGYDASPISRPAHAAVAPESGYVAALRTKDAQISALEADLAKDRRHLRALEHALATESGPRAKRAYFVMTAPTKRLVEAVRRRR